MTCTHHQIQTWRVADTYEPAMWSCTNCGQKFVPLTQQMIDDEALLRQALEALDKLYLPGELERVNAAITAIRAHLEGKG